MTRSSFTKGIFSTTTTHRETIAISVEAINQKALS